MSTIVLDGFGSGFGKLVEGRRSLQLVDDGLRPTELEEADLDEK
jgi:hypothetical protein